MARLTLRPTLIGVSVSLALLIAACGGDSDDPTATPGPNGGATPVPTASPFASVPAPTILDISGGTVTDEPVQDINYIVVAGDTLSRIAGEFDTTVEALLEANGLADPSIFVGQELVIPGTSGGVSTPATPTPRPSTGVQTYVVQAGDGGFGIALEFGITLEALAAANGLTVDDLNSLQIGQELLIPAP